MTHHRHHDSSEDDQKGQKVGGAPIPRNLRPFSKIIIIFLPLISLWNYPAYKTNHPIFWHCLSPSEMAHTQYMECVSLLTNLFALYYGSLLNSFLHEAKDPHLMASPRDSLETCDMTVFLHPFFWQQYYLHHYLYYMLVHSTNPLNGWWVSTRCWWWDWSCVKLEFMHTSKWTSCSLCRMAKGILALHELGGCFLWF